MIKTIYDVGSPDILKKAARAHVVINQKIINTNIASNGRFSRLPLGCLPKEVSFSGRGRSVIVSKDNLNGIRIGKRRAAFEEVRMMPSTKHHGLVHTVWEKTAVAAHIMPAKPEEKAIVYRDRCFLSTVSSTADATPVSCRIRGC
eukprot:4626859-Amphidinium_carterae.1